MKPIIYLSGPIARCSDAEAKDWREYVKSRNGRSGIFETVDPMDRDFRGKIKDLAVCKMIVELDYFDIRTRANCLLANINFEKPMVGTIMEIKDAYDHGKLTVVNMPADEPVSPWLTYHSHKITYNLEEALNYILKAFD